MSFRLFFFSLLIVSVFSLLPAWGANSPADGIPILLYHRFGPTVADSMTITTDVFESHLTYLREKGYSIIPLKQLVDYYRNKGPVPPPRSVVIVADDGHKTVYTDMFPLIKKYKFPVTLFIYPSAISNPHAPYAMNWEQLKELRQSGFIDIQSHTFWHPNFKKDKKKMTQQEYDKSVEMQFRKSRERLEKELGVRVDMLAWPFGIYDDELAQKAADTGYIAAFTIERRHTRASDSLMALPRYLMINANKGKAFESILAGNAPPQKVVY